MVIVFQTLFASKNTVGKKIHEKYFNNPQKPLFHLLQVQPTDLPRTDNSDKYLYLEAVSPHFTKFKKIPVSYENGFLFIHTDKPVYTPDQSGKLYVFLLAGI